MSVAPACPVVRGAAWVAASVLSGLAASLYLELRATSALSLALVAGAAWLHAAAPEPTRPREGAASAALGALFALFAVAGRLSERGEWIRYLAHRTVVPGRVSAVVYAGVFAGLALLFRSAILALGARLDGASIRTRAVSPTSERRVRLLAWAAILGCWAPYLLCTWPGILTPDSRSQVLQALGRVPLNDHHPIAHTLLVAGALRLGEIVFGSLEAGLATYSVAQAALLSWTFAWIAGRLHREGVRPSVLVAAVASAALLPLHAMYAVTMWKNIPFACAVVGESFALWDLARARDDEARTSALVAFAGFGTLSVLLQRNGAAAFLLPAAVAVLASGAPLRRRALAAAAIPFAVLLLVRGASRRAEVAGARDLVFAGIAIPVQQVARALADGAEPSPEQRAMLETLAPLDRIARTYDRKSVDPMKAIVNGRQVDAIRAEAPRWAILWASLGAAHPRSYLAAFRDQTCGYWFPDVPYSNIWQTFEAQDLGVERRRLLGDFPCRVVTSFAAYSENLPLLGALRSIGLWVWLALFMATHAFVRGRRAALACFAPVAGLWASLLLSAPIHAEVRYLYPLYLLAPLLVAAPLLDDGAAAGLPGESR